MGTRKFALEKTKETGKEIGKKGLDKGAKILDEASEIDSILDSINLDIDEDDAKAVETGKKGYRAEMNKEFQQQAETPSERASEKLDEVRQQSEAEKEKVVEIGSKFERVGEASDIGRNVAEQGMDAMKSSTEFYEKISAEAIENAEQTREEIARLEAKLDELF